MAGIKRRVDVADDRGGKRTKVKKDMSKRQEPDIKAKKPVKSKKIQEVERSSEDEADNDEGMELNEEEESGFLSEDDDSEGGMEIGEEPVENGAAPKNGK